MTEKIKRGKNYILLSALLCAVSVFGIYQYNRAKKLEYSQDLEYNRVFAELSEYVDDIDISLLKGQLVNSAPQMTKFSADLYRQASAAKANLAMLPVGEIQLEKTSEFLSQIGEYATCISEKMQRNEKISLKEMQTMGELSSYAKKLKNKMDELQLGISDGNISFTDAKLKNIFSGGSVAMATELEGLEEEFHGYPSLVYDGPFSQHLTLKEAVLTKGKAEITENQAIKKAKAFITEGKCKTAKIEGVLPSISIKSNETTVEYTRDGGILLLLMKNRMPDEAKIDKKEAKTLVEKFLRENGFENMKESYYENREGSVVINYAYEQDGYIVYPDLVKVKVALDNGEIIGLESRGYIMNHTVRDIPKPVITEEQALANINNGLKTETVTMAVIPLENGEEAPCYQIRGIVGDKHFLVYVNTQTGDVEDMQILLESESGVLAV